MHDRTTASLALELVKRVRLPSLANTFWILRICLLLFTFFVISNWAEVVKAVSGLFSGQVTEAVEVVEDGMSEIVQKQIELEAKVDAISNHKNDVIEEIQILGEQFNENSATTNTQTPGTVEIIETELLTIAPTAPLSESDVIIKRENSSLYIGETKNTNLKPSSLE